MLAIQMQSSGGPTEPVHDNNAIHLLDLLEKGFTNKKGGWLVFLFLKTCTGEQDERSEDMMLKTEEDVKQDSSPISSVKKDKKKADSKEDQGEDVSVRIFDMLY